MLPCTVVIIPVTKIEISFLSLCHLLVSVEENNARKKHNVMIAPLQLVSFPEPWYRTSESEGLATLIPSTKYRIEPSHEGHFTA